MQSKDASLRLRRGFPPAFCGVLLVFSFVRAWGITANLRPGHTVGDALLNAFGGCIWSEEVDIQYDVGWLMIFIPVGIAACFVASQHMAGWVRMSGYRYRSVSHWYRAFMGEVMLAAGVAAVIQILCVLLLAVARGSTGLTVWVEDADGFSVQNIVQPCLSPLLFLLYGEAVTLAAVDAFLVLRKTTWYYVVFLLPSLIGSVACSNPGKTSLWNPIHFGMARRLAVEGGYGAQPAVACCGLILLMIVLWMLGGVYCRFASPFERSYE